METGATGARTASSDEKVTEPSFLNETPTQPPPHPQNAALSSLCTHPSISPPCWPNRLTPLSRFIFPCSPTAFLLRGWGNLGGGGWGVRVTFSLTNFCNVDLWVASVAYLSIWFQIVELAQGQGFRFIFPTDYLLSKSALVSIQSLILGSKSPHPDPVAKKTALIKKE